MTEEELAQLLVDLEILLQDLGLDFVVNQERVLAAEGISTLAEDLGRQAGDYAASRPSSASLFTSEGAEPENVFSTGRPALRRPVLKKTDVLVRPLTTRERLAVLLDLIEVTTAGTVAMEQLVQVEFGQAVTFEDPPEAGLLGRISQSWRIAGDVIDRATRAEVVVGMVDELRAHADIPRGDWLRRHDVNDTEYTWTPTKTDR